MRWKPPEVRNGGQGYTDNFEIGELRVFREYTERGGLEGVKFLYLERTVSKRNTQPLRHSKLPITTESLKDSNLGSEW